MKTQIVDGHEVVILKAKSYRQAQERQRVAEALLQAEKEEIARTEAWARDCLARERQLSDRCTYLYGLAARLGASDDDLRGPS